MIKTKLSDYKTKKITIWDESGAEHELEVRSMASREFKDAIAEYNEIINHAKSEGIALEDKVNVNHGLEVKSSKTVMSEYARKALAILISSLVVYYPLESDLKQDIFENEDFANLIDLTGSELQREFLAKKKT